LQAYEAGKLESVPDMDAELKFHKEAAEATFKKDQRLNIRIATRDLKNLQAMALF
jgi:predicted DNA binding CopG/RHH family protein